MQLDLGTVILVVAVLVFYLRLIIIQQQRAWRLATYTLEQAARPRRKSKKGAGQARQEPRPARMFSILSPRPLDRLIALTGVIAIVLGILLNLSLLPLPWALPYWWLPVSADIVAFSFAFR